MSLSLFIRCMAFEVGGYYLNVVNWFFEILNRASKRLASPKFLNLTIG